LVVKRVRDAWKVTLESQRTSSSPILDDTTFGVAYVALTEAVLQQGNLAFSVAYTDTVGNAGVPVTAITGRAGRMLFKITENLPHRNGSNVPVLAKSFNA